MLMNDIGSATKIAKRSALLVARVLGIVSPNMSSTVVAAAVAINSAWPSSWIRLSATEVANAAMAVQSGDFIFYPDRPDLENGAADLWGTSPLYRIYLTADSSLFLAVVEEAHWRALGQIVNHPDLLQNYSLQTASEEDADGALSLTLADIFQTQITTEWITRLDLAGIPCAPILSIAELFADEHIAANNLITTHRHPEWGEVRQTGLFATFSRTPTAIPRVAPILGQHTCEVLHEVAGYDMEKVSQLLEAGAIKQAEER